MSILVKGDRATSAHPECRHQGKEPEEGKPQHRMAARYHPPPDRQIGEQHTCPEDGIVRLDPGGRCYAIRPDHQDDADGDYYGRCQVREWPARDPTAPP